MRTFLACIVLCAVSGSSASAALFSHTYNTAQMPSAQGYTYFGLNSGLTEAQVFSVSGGTITANSMGNGFQGQGSNSVHLGVAPANFMAGQDYVIEARVRVLESERVSFHFGFYIGGWFDGMSASIGLQHNTLQSASLAIVQSRDNAVWTDWRLVTDRTLGVYRVYADNALLYTDTLQLAGSPGFGLPDNYFAFGDGTGGANARAELTSFSARQIPVPAPGAAALLGLGGLASARRRQRT